MVDVRWALSPHVGGLAIEAVGRRAKVRVLGPGPGRVLIDPRVWHAVARVVVRRSHLCREVSLGIVEAVRVGWPLKRVTRGEVILHEAGWEAVEVVGVWRLVELWVLLVGWEGPTEVGRPLHPERWLTLGTTPGWWLMLIVPWSFKLVIPIGIWLVVPGSISLPIPARVPTLLAPHALMAVVPGWAVRWSTLVVWVRRLLRGLLLTPRSNRVRLIKPRGLVWRDLLMGARTPWASSCRILNTCRGIVL